MLNSFVSVPLLYAYWMILLKCIVTYGWQCNWFQARFLYYIPIYLRWVLVFKQDIVYICIVGGDLLPRVWSCGASDLFPSWLCYIQVQCFFTINEIACAPVIFTRDKEKSEEVWLFLWQKSLNNGNFKKAKQKHQTPPNVRLHNNGGRSVWETTTKSVFGPTFPLTSTVMQSKGHTFKNDVNDMYAHNKDQGLTIILSGEDPWVNIKYIVFEILLNI